MEKKPEICKTCQFTSPGGCLVAVKSIEEIERIEKENKENDTDSSECPGWRKRVE